MDVILYVLMGGSIGIVITLIGAVFVFKGGSKKAEGLLEEAQRTKDGILREARQEATKIEERALSNERDQRQKVEQIEKRVLQREEQLDEKLERLEKTREELVVEREDMRKREEQLYELEKKEREELERISGLSADDAKEVLLTKYEKEFESDILAHVKKMEDTAMQEADKKAKKVIGLAIQKYANEVASESMATIVDLEDDGMKGRIIGREGRNINTFERLTGIDVIVDDTPGSILISGFDHMRRFIAKKSLLILIEDGRIHPARIEEVVEKVKQETDELVMEFGEKAVMELGFHGLHPNLIKMIGRMRFRSSYGQNILKHSMEVAYICAKLAEEIGADVKLAKMAGFFHDIGKAVTHEVDGPHAVIGATILRKFDMDERLINCVESHHNDVEPQSVEAILTSAADAISGARPGARSDTAEQYIQRMQDLENVASSFEGVQKVFAIQAGREVRVIVDPEEITDLESKTLAKDIAAKMEEELQYPGEIKVNVIRESRMIEFAR